MAWVLWYRGTRTEVILLWVGSRALYVTFYILFQKGLASRKLIHSSSSYMSMLNFNNYYI